MHSDLGLALMKVHSPLACSPGGRAEKRFKTLRLSSLVPSPHLLTTKKSWVCFKILASKAKQSTGPGIRQVLDTHIYLPCDLGQITPLH